MDVIVDIAIYGVIISAIVSALLTFFRGLGVSQVKREAHEPTLEDRVSSLTKNLTLASSIISDMEQEISKRKNLAKQLETDIERYNTLKEVKEAQVEAIAQTLRIPLIRESRKTIIINGLITFGVAFVFFVIGYFVAGR